MKKPYEMLSTPSSLWILIFSSITVTTALDADSAVICNETYYLEIGKSSVVSCQYDHSFYAVRWNRNGESDFFLRIDGKNKGGSGYTSGEFDIQNDGSMVIPEVKLEHENNYTISVLDSSAVVHSRQLGVYVTVLWDEISLVDCKISNRKICNELGIQRMENALICITSNSRPPVNITWKTASVRGHSDILTPISNRFILNATSLMYTTFSVVQYHEEYFALEYVTCLASSTEISKAENISVYLEGKKKFVKSTTDVQYVKWGYPYQLECPPSRFELGLLKYHHPNGTSKILMEFTEGTENECTFADDCEIKQHRRFTIEKVSFTDEGSYECVFGNGAGTRNRISNLTVVVLPANAMTIIENCERNPECTQNTVPSGTLKCSIVGLRPSVHLSFEVAENSNEDIFLYNVKNQVVPSHDGISFDTILTAEYDIKECSEPVIVTCKTDTNIHNDITMAQVSLVTDNRHCTDDNSNSILVVLLIVVLVVVIIASSVAFFIWRKYGTRQREESPGFQESQSVQESQSLPLRPTNTNEEKTEHRTEDAKVDGKGKITRQDEKTEKERKARKALQEIFDNKLLPMIEGIKSSTVTTDEFVAVLTEFNTEHKVDPIIFVEGFITGDALNTEELVEVIKFVGGSVSNKWISVENYSHLLKVFVSSKKPPVDGILDVLRESYHKDLINLSAYAGITESFLTRQNVDFDKLFTEMKELTKDNKYSKSELVNGILQFYVISAITQQDVLNSVSFSGLPNKIAYPHFLQMLVCHIKGSETEEKLQNLFNIIVKKAMADKKPPPDKKYNPQDETQAEKKAKASLQDEAEIKFKEKVLDTLNSSQREDLKNKLSSIFLRVLLYSVEKKTIKINECMNILTEEVDEMRISKAEYEKTVDLCSQDNWLSIQKLIDILQASLENNLITQGFFIIHLQVLVPKKEIRFKDFIEILESNLEKRVITENSFEEQFRYYLKLDEWNKENWIRLVCRLWTKKIIGDALKLTLINAVVDKYQMKKTDIKGIIERLGVGPEDRKAFIRDVEFPGLIERATHGK